MFIYSLPGVSYKQIEVEQFALQANRAYGSPSESVLHDFSTHAVTTDQLFLMLKKMDHIEGMKLLEKYGMKLLLLVLL